MKLLFSFFTVCFLFMLLPSCASFANFKIHNGGKSDLNVIVLAPKFNVLTQKWSNKTARGYMIEAGKTKRIWGDIHGARICCVEKDGEFLEGELDIPDRVKNLPYQGTRILINEDKSPLIGASYVNKKVANPIIYESMREKASLSDDGKWKVRLKQLNVSREVQSDPAGKEYLVKREPSELSITLEPAE